MSLIIYLLSSAAHSAHKYLHKSGHDFKIKYVGVPCAPILKNNCLKFHLVDAKLNYFKVRGIHPTGNF